MKDEVPKTHLCGGQSQPFPWKLSIVLTLVVCACWVLLRAAGTLGMHPIFPSTIETKFYKTNESVTSPLESANQSVGKHDAALLSSLDGGQVVDIGIDFLFWNGRSLICKLIENMTGVTALGEVPPAYALEKNPLAPRINLTLDCEALENVGNWITALYHMRLVCALGRVGYQFQCSSGMASAYENILPWFSGYYPPPHDLNTWPYDFGWPDPKQACSKEYKNLPLQHLAHEMQQDMRRIAVAMLGPRHFNTSGLNLDTLDSLIHHPHSVGILPLEYPSNPPFPRNDLEIDDAAIHFRCGDVFGLTHKDVYGLIPFRTYVERIPNDTTTSIGIHTQPFNASLLREADRDAAADCQRVVLALVDYLKQAYPHSKITIRNTINDTIPITYARMIMASQTITTMSTFGIFPAIGTFGQGYYQKSGRQNRFAQHIPDVLPNVHVMEGPILSSPTIAKSSWDAILDFLTG